MGAAMHQAVIEETHTGSAVRIYLQDSGANLFAGTAGAKVNFKDMSEHRKAAMGMTVSGKTDVKSALKTKASVAKSTAAKAPVARFISCEISNQSFKACYEKVCEEIVCSNS